MRKPVNRFDEQMKDFFRSKTLRVYLIVLLFIFCILPAACLCLSAIGAIPISNYIGGLFT